MNSQSAKCVAKFKHDVGIRFQLYNSLFTSLPFHKIEKTGILLAMLSHNCDEGYKRGKSPIEIIDEFFTRYTNFITENEKTDLLFRFVQYTERQVVLFDALEDAAIKDINDFNGVGTLKHLESEVLQSNKEELLQKKLQDFSIRLVLTAHPTQFYPDAVLGIINDMANALQENNTGLVNTYLQQLGRTPFFNKQKPSPYDEAVSLIWYLENVFYKSAGRILNTLKTNFADGICSKKPIIHMGFWPGGDRDGNPFVTSDITIKVAEALRSSIVKCYYLDVRRLRRRITFSGVDVLLQNLEAKLFNNFFLPNHEHSISKQDMLETLDKIKQIIVYQHNGLFLHLVTNLINKVALFGFNFATLDIRQDSSVHEKIYTELAGKIPGLPENYGSLTEDEKINCITSLAESSVDETFTEDVFKDTINTIKAIKPIQATNGELGCNRYVISHCASTLNAIEVFGLFLIAGWEKEKLSVDIIPLFETIDDLLDAPEIMKKLYQNSIYRKHLTRRNDCQTIMLGFSDGTKDGGYLKANWSIFKAKEALTAISKENGIDVIFFDGRGGPPSRGGGKTHNFYASMGQNVSNKEIQLTIQGQTISSSFGTIDAAQFNMEQLLSAGITNELFMAHRPFTDEEETLLQQIADYSHQSYQSLRDHPYLTSYLLHASPLRYYSETNIGSRPAKRGAAKKLSLSDLRAIPFVGSLSQLKQNVPGFYGVGTALKLVEEKGDFPAIKKLYSGSLFFRTLIDNCEMALSKSFLPLTEYLSKHPQYGEVWQLIKNEYLLAKEYVLKLSGNTELMANYPVDQLSIQMRERIILPILTIQQFSLSKIRSMEEMQIDDKMKPVYEKLVMRCSFGIINAGRNSA